MSIAKSLEKVLDGRGVSYDVVEHAPTSCASATADQCHIDGDNLAKGVLLKRRNGYALAIVPASCRVALREVSSWLNEPVELATEQEVESVFADCETGSIPPVPAAYGLSSVMDDSFSGLKDVYFEGGDHCTLVHVRGSELHKLMHDVPQAHISRRIH